MKKKPKDQCWGIGEPLGEGRAALRMTVHSSPEAIASGVCKALIHLTGRPMGYFPMECDQCTIGALEVPQEMTVLALRKDRCEVKEPIH